MGFQTSVNVELGFGIAGALYDDGPVRSAPYELNSTSAAYNVVGATAYTVSSGDPANGSGCAVAAAGGTGAFAGILMNSKVYSTNGTTAGALNPSMALPNYFIGELLTMGDIVVTLPGSANIGDLVGYDKTTGALATYPAIASFTASMATTGVLSVSAVTSGMLQVGQYISGTGIPANTVITALGTGTGYTGTYTTSAVGVAAVSAEAMTAPSLPPPAASVTATFLTASVLSVSAVGSGQLGIGSVLYGTGVPADTVITAFGTGTGGTGTYTTNAASSFTLASGTVTSDLLIAIPNASVYRVAPAGGSNSVGVVKITN